MRKRRAFRSCCASTAAFARQRSAKSCCPPSATYCTRARAAPSFSAQLRGLDVGTVTVGTAYSAFYSPLARIISDFHARYGGIQVQLRGGYSTELITQLNAHQLDLCFISAREGGHDWLPIGYDELTAWVPAAHPMAWLPALPVAAFAKEPYIETYPDKDIDNARRPSLRLCGHPARRAARLLSSLFICALSERRVRRRGAGACDR